MSSVYTVRYAPQALDDLPGSLLLCRIFAQRASYRPKTGQPHPQGCSLTGCPARRYPVVDWEPWQSMGMHRFTVENFLLFYLIDQSTRTVTLVRIVYGGRDLQNLAK